MEVPGKELELQEGGEELVACRGIRNVGASPVKAWRVSEVEERSSWQEQVEGSSVPHLTMQATRAPISVSQLPAPKLAIPTLTGLTGNTER